MDSTRTEETSKIFEGVAERLGIVLVVADAKERVVWTSPRAVAERDLGLTVGESVARQIEARFVVIDASALTDETEGLYADLDVGWSLLAPRSDPGSAPNSDLYRYTRFAIGGSRDTAQESTVAKIAATVPAEAAEEGATVHCLVETRRERRWSERLRNNLAQLMSMREISDRLYESLSTEEVIDLILIAVTAHVGFGFNRAFFLEAVGDRLRGAKGIGPSDAQEANEIWQNLESTNLTSIRALYREATERGHVPDRRTRELATRMNFPVADPQGDSRLMLAVASRKPCLLHEGESDHPVDRELFGLLSTREIAVVPLHVRQSLAGVLVADNFVTREPITSHDLEVLRSFSRYASLALERSQLHDEQRQSVTKLQEANETLKTSQRKLLQAEKLSAVGELAACVSHEIRNPLVAIGGLARSLLRTGDDLSAKSLRTLEMISEQVTRLEKFLRETLDFVKPEVNGMTSLDLRDELRRAVEPIEAQLQERSIDLILQLGDEPVRCLVAPDLFHRAVTNLVINAMEALGKAGTIQLSARCVGHTAEVDVADTGPGIPPELRTRVFDPFFTTRPEGTGLGLAIAAQSIRTLGGQISLQAHDPFKTIFRITLPLEVNLSRGAPRESHARGATTRKSNATEEHARS